jgi:hypothetical protein
MEELHQKIDTIIFKSKIPDRSFASVNSDFEQPYVAVALEYNCQNSELTGSLWEMMLDGESGSSW